MQSKTLLFKYRCDINQAFYVTATPYSIQNHTFTGEPLHKTDIFCHSDLYRTLQEQRPSTKSRKNCRTVLFYGVFELFWPASITKMTQKMMDGLRKDTICWQMNCLRSAAAGNGQPAAQSKLRELRQRARSACFVPVIRKTQKQPEFYVEPELVPTEPSQTYPTATVVISI